MMGSKETQDMMESKVLNSKQRQPNMNRARVWFKNEPERDEKY